MSLFVASKSPLWMIVLCVQFVLIGCTRSQYRTQADREAYCTIAEKNNDPRWKANGFTIELDPRSRYFDPYDPDCSPLPKDDPASHQFMRQVNGMDGWEHWHDNGARKELENPAWQVRLGEYVDINDDGAVKLDIDSALKLAYVHSPNHQSQRETLYLAALDVIEERFALDTQFFGGYDLDYTHTGQLAPASIVLDGANDRFRVDGPNPRAESNRLTLGRDSGGNPAVQLSRQFATAGTLLAGFANSFVVEFQGPEAALSSSLFNFSIAQPLLAGGGRDIALEQLTFFERSLLANVRSYTQFRQGFYTQVVVGEQGVGGPQGANRGVNIQVFGGQAGLGGYVGLLQQQQQIRNSEDNLNLQLRTLVQLEALLDAGIIDLVQVDQFRQNVENERANLLAQRNNYENALDRYKTATLGLPPDLPIELDDTLIRQFQLVGRDATAVQDEISDLQDRLGEAAEDPQADQVRALKKEAIGMLKAVREQIDLAQSDVKGIKGSLEARTSEMSADEQESLESELGLLDAQLKELERQFADIQTQAKRVESGDFDTKGNSNAASKTSASSDESESDLDPLSFGFDDAQNQELLKSLPDKPGDKAPGLNGDAEEEPASPSDAAPGELSLPGKDDAALSAKKSIRATVVLLRQMLRVVQGSILVQARSRLEAVTVDDIDLDSKEAFQVALANRLDFMNGRAALVDTWRLIQFNADALQSVLNFTASGDVRTAKNNPLNFRASTSTARIGVQFDAPFTRLVERNNYRAALINYQRDRREFIQARDSLHQGLRILLRQIEQLKLNLEIQRRAVAIAIRRVDLTRAALYAPVPPPLPGQRSSQFGPTAAINLLSAQSALRDTQNAFLSAWLNYYAARMRLARELGVMTLDPNGKWAEQDMTANSENSKPEIQLIESDQILTNVSVVPPDVSDDLMKTVESLPEDFKFETPADGPPKATDNNALKVQDALLE